jgi:hypothetical protein
MHGRLAILLFVGSVSVARHGCTYRAWHAGLREQQQQDCYKKASQDVMYKCLDRINSMTYEQYIKAHEDLKQHIQ